MVRTTSAPAPAPLASLYASLGARRRPEDVAETVRELLGDALTPNEARRLDRAARGSLKRNLWGYTSMLQDFARPVGCAGQVATACEPFATAYPRDRVASLTRGGTDLTDRAGLADPSVGS